jgi:gliding motility-associated-like protein
MNIWDPQGKWELDTVKQLIIGGVSSKKYAPIKITNETFLVESELGFNIGLNARGLALFFEKGVHQVVITENATGCTDTIRTFVSCLKTDYISETIEVGKKDTVCLDITELFSDPVKTTNIFVDSKNKNVDFSISADKKCVIFKGNIIGNDTAKIVACDKYGYCDTTYFYIDVIKGVVNPPKGTTFKDTILVGESATYCIDTMKYLAGKALKSFNAKSTTNYANIDLDAKKFCINYKGIKSIGTDTSIIILCSVTKCDTFKAYITVLPAPLPKDVVIDTIPLLSSYTYCLPASKFSGIDLTKTPLTVTNTCIKTNSPVGFTIQQTATCTAPTGFGYSIIYKGNKIGKDTACVTVKDSTGKTATLKVVVYVTPRKPYLIQDTIIVKQQEVYCLENIKLDINADIDTIWNSCPNTKNPEVKFDLIKTVNCKSGFGINASGLKAGKDTACIVVKDKLGNLDTASVYITVIQPKAQSKIIYDTLVIFQDHSTCIDTVTLGVKGFVSITNICPKSGGEKVVFAVVPKGDCTVNGVKGLKISWTGAEVGTDTACWVIKDKTGKMDTIRTIVTVRKPKPSVIKEVVEVDGTLILCPDKTEVDKSITKIINACPSKSGKDVKFVLDTMTNCVKITGLKVGVDTACIVIVDQFDLTDTTTMIITVVPKGSILVTAIDDNQSGTKNNNIKINVLANDKYNKGDSLNVKIKVIPVANGGIGPKKGAVINVDNKTGVVTYMPEFDFCGKDSFLYSLCIGSKCDTAKVIIDIKCDTAGKLTIYNAFSPNGDGNNQKFIIDGIENPTLKGNIVVILNRWGNEVYRKTDYDNSWEGTWGGKELPDGTYYYILCYPEGDKTTIKSGFLELRR